MTSLFSYLITMFAGIFWILRIIIAITYNLGIDIGITPLNFNIEIILLFVTLFCMVFIIKRNIFGALIYFVCYALYFGADLYNGIIKIMNGEVDIASYGSLILSFLGVLIPFLTVMDIFLNKDRKGSNKDKKTDWFYTNKKYERQFDERADKNQYKF